MPYIPKLRDPMLKVIGAYGLERSRTFGAVIGKSPNMALRRLKNPEEITLGELRKLASKGHVPIDEIRSAV